MSGSFWDQLEANRNASISVFHQYIRHANVMWRRITLLPAVAVVKGTVVPLNSVEAYWAAEAEVYAFWTSAQVGASHTGPFNPGERLPSIPLIRRLGGLHGRHGRFWGKKELSYDAVRKRTTVCGRPAQSLAQPLWLLCLACRLLLADSNWKRWTYVGLMWNFIAVV